MEKEKTEDRLSILVVDDYFLIRRNHKLLLEKLGFEVIEATNGKEALSKLQQKGTQYFSLLIVDLMMPVMSGAEFMLKAREVYGDELPPVLVCSSASDVPLVKKIAALGIIGYIVKPVDYKILIKKLHEVIPEMDKR